MRAPYPRTDFDGRTVYELTEIDTGGLDPDPHDFENYSPLIVMRHNS